MHRLISRISLDSWAAILAIVATLLIHAGVVGTVPW
jgi:hypothetical protein